MEAPSKSVDGPVDPTHKGADGRHSTTATGSQTCFSWNRAKDGCSSVCSSNRAHACECCLEPHRAIECPLNPGWKPPAEGAITRLPDSRVESMKKCPKMNEGEDAQPRCSGVSPRTQQIVKGAVAASQSCLAGVIVWPFTHCQGNLQSAEHFEQLKVAVKHRSRGPWEVTKLCCHQVREIMPSRNEVSCLVELGEFGLKQVVGFRANQEIVGSRRRSLHPCNDIPSLDQCATVEVRGRFERLLCKFQQFLNRPESDHKPGELTVTMDEVTGAGEQQSLSRFGRK